jgi:enoyl-CoA hydratase/carnithine racemase
VILGCDDIDAGTAERYGLVNRVLPAEMLDPFTERLSERIAGFPESAVQRAKRVVLLEDGDTAPSLEREHHAWLECVTDPSSTTAMNAFLAAGGQTAEHERRLPDVLNAVHVPN